MSSPTATAKLNSTLLAQSSTYEVVEGNIYFPPSSLIDRSKFTESSTHTKCPWKGIASYYNIEDAASGKVIKDAAWYYPEPLEGKGAEKIKDFVAFYKNKVNVSTE